MNDKLISICLMASFMFVSSFVLEGQDYEADSLKAVLSRSTLEFQDVDIMHRLAKYYVSKQPDSSLVYATRAFKRSSALNDQERHARSFRRLGHAYYVNRDYDSMKSTLHDYIHFAELTKQYDKIAPAYRNLSKIGEATKEPDSSLFYLKKCLNTLEMYPDKRTLIDVYLSKGLIYKYKGFYQSSLESLLTGLRLSESLERPYKLGYFYMNLAITSAMMDRLDESISYSRKAIEVFRKKQNIRAVIRSQNNLAIALSNTDQVDEAIQAFRTVIDLSEPTKMPNLAMHSHNGLADIYFKKGNYNLATQHIDSSDLIGQ